MKKKFDYTITIMALLFAFAAFVSSCASESQRPYNTYVTAKQRQDSVQNNAFKRVEYYTQFTTSHEYSEESYIPCTARAYIYDDSIELFIMYEDDGANTTRMYRGKWLDEFTFRSEESVYMTFNEEYLDYTAKEIHYELIK